MLKKLGSYVRPYSKWVVLGMACSTAEALAWDAAFRDRNDPSGRAVLGVHNTDLTHS